MFEKYIEQKEQNLAEQINLTAEYINLFEMIFNPKIEQAYKTYFSAEVDWWLYEEQIARKANLRFDFDNPKLNAFMKQMDDLYKKNARFSGVSLPLIISMAVKTRLNYLCRPRTALKWFIYRWDQTKTYHEIVKRLNYLEDYKYLKDGLIEYVRVHKLINTSDDLINIATFDKIINEIDGACVSKMTPEGFIQLMSPLFSFFNSDADHKDTAKIPVEAVIVFFDDKKLNALANRLESMFRSGELQLISKKYLLGLIYKSLYEADLMYGGGNDNVTDVTNEIVTANSSYSENPNLSNDIMPEMQLPSEPMKSAITPETEQKADEFEIPGIDLSAFGQHLQQAEDVVPASPAATPLNVDLTTEEGCAEAIAEAIVSNAANLNETYTFVLENL